MAEPDGAKLLFRKVHDCLATCTHKMVMRSVIWLHAERAMMHAHFAKDAAVEERANVLVNRTERNRRDLLPDFVENGFRAGVAVERHDSLKNDLPLVRGRQAVTTANFPESRNRNHSQTITILI